MSEQSTNVAVLIATEDPNVLALALALRAEGIEARVVGSSVEAQAFAERAARYVAVLDAELPQETSFQIYRLLHGEQPIPTLVLVPAGSYQTFALDPHRATLDEYAAKPVRADELALRVRALMLRAGYPLPTPPAPGSPLPEATTPDLTRHGKIVSVFSTKGGVGKSTIATSIAVGLVRFFNAKVLLVDADLWFGDLGVLMNVFSSNSLFDAWTGDELDLMRLSKAPVAHDSGVSILLRPPDPAMAEKLEPNVVIKAITTFTALYDYIVVDTHPALDELTLQVLDMAAQILLITTPEISAVHNTSRFLKIADTVGYTEKITLVLNRANTGVKTESLEQQLDLRVAASIVSSGRVVVEAANRGVPVLLADPNGEEEITRGLTHVVELVAGAERPQPSAAGRAGGPFLKGRGQRSGLAFWRGSGR